MTIVRQKERFDLIYERDHQFSSEYLLAKLFRIPLVKEVNGLLVDEAKISGQAGKVALRMMGRIDRFNKPKADKIIVVTSRLKEILQEDDGVPSDKITVIQNGANIDLFKPMDVTKAREELGLNQSHKYVCFVGAFRAWEGIENIVKSTPLVLQKCPEARFLIVGDGPMKQELINLAEQVGVSDKVIFTGMVPYQEVPLYINASDVCVFPAAKNFRNDRTGGSPLKLHEYMACGKPVVVGNITGVSEHIMDTDSGFVVDPTNAIEMARAIIALLENEQLRKEMGERGRKVTIEKYSWMKVAEQVAEVCQSVIKNRR
jgi:glycosyltransferase involved in cell wall biosynthesis